MRFERFQPVTNWPQETLQVPGAGSRFGMPPVDHANAYVNGRQAFTNSAIFSVTAAQFALGTIHSQTIETEADGDFWASQIYATGFGTNGGVTTNTVPPGNLQITDLRTGRQLAYPRGVALGFLTKRFEDTSTPAGADQYVPPSAWRGVGTLPEPFCFTRKGGIRLDLQSRTNGTALVGWAFEISIAFGGWKEYAHASGL